MARVLELDQVEAIVKWIDDCSFYVERNANPKVLFLNVSIQIHHIIKRWDDYQQRQAVHRA